MAELDEAKDDTNHQVGTPESGVHVEGWNFDSDEEEAATGARRSTRLSTKGVASLKLPGDKATAGMAQVRTERKPKAALTAPGEDMSNRLAVEVRDALNAMMATMTLLLQDRGQQQASRRTDEESDASMESFEEEEPPKAESRKAAGRTRTAKKDPPKSPPNKDRRYYAVARGRKPGVYTDWGQAERQVNGFSGALHKKFKTRVEAQRFVDNYRTKGHDESEGESEGAPTESEDDTSEEEKPRK
jgi:hypothetical protein